MLSPDYNKILIRKVFFLPVKAMVRQYLTGMWARWFSETCKGGTFDFLVRFTTTFFRFAHSFFISAIQQASLGLR
jgi:hypothetical protein